MRPAPETDTIAFCLQQSPTLRRWAEFRRPTGFRLVSLYRDTEAECLRDLGRVCTMCGVEGEFREALGRQGLTALLTEGE